MLDRRRRELIIGLVQHRCTTDREANTLSLEEGIRRAASQGAQIISTQELFRSQYFCQVEDYKHFALAETIPGPGTKRLCIIAQELTVVLVASLFEQRAPGLYHNTAVVIDADGTLLGKYRKMHIPDDPLFYEKFYFTPGDLGFLVWHTRYARIGVGVCWDQWYPEAARLLALRGAQILFFPTAIGWHPNEKFRYGQRQCSAWEVVQRGHAIANGCYLAVANRVGHEVYSGDGIEFWGQSFVCDPFGEILQKGSTSDEEIVVAKIDLDLLGTQRQHWPFLRDRRIDAYRGILRRFIDS